MVKRLIKEMSVLVKFIAKRLLQLVIVLLVASVLIFTMVRLSDTDPVAVILGGKQTSPETMAAMRARFHLDKPLAQQYFIWIGGMLHGDFGLSFKYQTQVSGLLAGRIVVTLGLVALGSVLALVVAIPLGILCAHYKHTLVDRIGSIFALILAGCPAFLTSILMILVITKVNPAYPFTGSWSTPLEFLERMLLPAVALAFCMVALAMRVTRSSMIEQQSAPYTMTAVAKGASDARVIFRHNLKNAVIPVIAVVSIQIGGMVVGAVLVENVFSLAGLGTLLVDSIKASDYAVVEDITMLLIVMFMVISTAVDIIYALIDPRIRVQ